MYVCASSAVRVIGSVVDVAVHGRGNHRKGIRSSENRHPQVWTYVIQFQVCLYTYVSSSVLIFGSA